MSLRDRIARNQTLPPREPISSENSLRRVVFGTAGHIDHGKTSLLKALTGITKTAPPIAGRGDRFILRRLSLAAALGGGKIPEPGWRRRRGTGPVSDLEALSGGEREAFRSWIEGQAPRGMAAGELTGRLRSSSGSMMDSGWDRFSVPQFKDHFGLTRKWAIPLLEYRDSIGFIRRVGNERMVVQGNTREFVA